MSYPKEVIMEYRRKLEAGDFDRKIVGQEPVDLDDDLVELSCGHTMRFSVQLLELARQCAKGNKREFQQACKECQQEWLNSRENSR